MSPRLACRLDPMDDTSLPPPRTEVHRREVPIEAAFRS